MPRSARRAHQLDELGEPSREPGRTSRRPESHSSGLTGGPLASEARAEHSAQPRNGGNSARATSGDSGRPRRQSSLTGAAAAGRGSISHKGPARWASERYHAGRATRRLRPDETSMQSRPAYRPSELETIADQILANYDTGPRAMHHLGATSSPSKPRSRNASRPFGRCSCRASSALLWWAPPATTCERSCSRNWGNYAEGSRQVYRGLHHRCELPLDNVTARCTRCSELSEGITSRFLVALPELRASLADRRRSGVRRRSGRNRHRRGHLLLPRPLRDRLLPHGEPVASRGGQHHPAHDDRACPREHGHRHPPRRHHRQSRSSSTMAPASSSAGPAVIGDRVRIYQGVTLGALSVPQGKGARRRVEEAPPDDRRRGDHLRQRHHPRRRDGDRARGAVDRRQLLGHHVGRARRAHHGRRMRHPGEQRATWAPDPQDSHEPLSTRQRPLSGRPTINPARNPTPRHEQRRTRSTTHRRPAHPGPSEHGHLARFRACCPTAASPMDCRSSRRRSDHLHLWGMAGAMPEMPWGARATCRSSSPAGKRPIARRPLGVLGRGHRPLHLVRRWEALLDLRDTACEEGPPSRQVRPSLIDGDRTAGENRW